MGFMDLLQDDEDKLKTGASAASVAADPVKTRQSTDFGATAIIALITSAIAAGASVAGSSVSASAAEEASNKAAAEGKRQFNVGIQEERREAGLKGMEHLTGQRQQATVASRQRNFWRDLVHAGGL